MTPVWLALPVADPAKGAAALGRWQARGYRVAVLTDGDIVGVVGADLNVRIPAWFGYPHAIRTICMALRLKNVPHDWIVAAGDDMDPDPHADPMRVAAECEDHFGGTFGVMQPTGDRQGIDASGRASSERICGSPWMGREFIERIYGGNGPYWPGYFHFFNDEEMQRVCEKLGILWQRPDLCQFHHHWSFERTERPAYMAKAQARWAQDQALFAAREIAGFPGHQPLLRPDLQVQSA